MMLGIAPVLNGNGQGPHRGMLMFGRLLGAEEIARIGEQAQVRLGTTATRTSLSTPAAFLPSGTLASDTQALVVGSQVTEVYRVIADPAGLPLLTLRIEVPRVISARGRAVVQYATVFLIGAGAVALILLIVLINRSVLSPLANVTRHAVRIGQSDDLTTRLALDRADEIGALAREFDQMVERLATARAQLVDQSFDAGVADYASGVLHNLGNAMTPLGVKVAGLQRALLEAPTADIDLVLAELQQGATDPDRRSDLVEFLKLTSQELARLMTTAQQELDSVAEQTQAISQAAIFARRQGHGVRATTAAHTSKCQLDLSVAPQAPYD
jgi:methyl-accepting chemotaxis protein